jgi:hypothetical protein
VAVRLAGMAVAFLAVIVSLLFVVLALKTAQGLPV